MPTQRAQIPLSDILCLEEQFGREAAAPSQAQLKLNLRTVQIAQHTSVPTDAPSDEAAVCVCVGRQELLITNTKTAMSDFKILVCV